jgi:hypothetical protein
MKTQHGNHPSPVIQQIWLPATILSVNELLYCVLHPMTVVMFAMIFFTYRLDHFSKRLPLRLLLLL